MIRLNLNYRFIFVSLLRFTALLAVGIVTLRWVV